MSTHVDEYHLARCGVINFADSAFDSHVLADVVLCLQRRDGLRKGWRCGQRKPKSKKESLHFHSPTETIEYSSGYFCGAYKISISPFCTSATDSGAVMYLNSSACFSVWSRPRTSPSCSAALGKNSSRVRCASAGGTLASAA